ncbi:MAG: hypothetical protein HUK15_02330, partial [Bacteroidales bacterium]|nr:hypothetical protein [Bacteroidales bacterium]
MNKKSTIVGKGMKRIIVATLILFACLTLKAQTLPTWLEGCWKITSVFDGNPSYTQWKVTDPSTIEGKTFRLFGNDTLFFDAVSIEIVGNETILKMAFD